MHYVLDTGFFILIRGYYPDTFPSFWEKISEMASCENETLFQRTDINGISSVYEVKEEIKSYGGKQKHLLDWINVHKYIFKRPSEEEQSRVRDIMTRFSEAIPEKKQLLGGFWADPFIIARAWHLGATVVTREHSLKNKDGEVEKFVKIPDICDILKIRCISPQKFMIEQEWKF